jgi:hypothetical protein
MVPSRGLGLRGTAFDGFEMCPRRGRRASRSRRRPGCRRPGCRRPGSAAAPSDERAPLRALHRGTCAGSGPAVAPDHGRRGPALCLSRSRSSDGPVLAPRTPQPFRRVPWRSELAVHAAEAALLTRASPRRLGSLGAPTDERARLRTLHPAASAGSGPAVAPDDGRRGTARRVPRSRSSVSPAGAPFRRDRGRGSRRHDPRPRRSRQRSGLAGPPRQR